MGVEERTSAKEGKGGGWVCCRRCKVEGGGAEEGKGGGGRVREEKEEKKKGRGCWNKMLVVAIEKREWLKDERDEGDEKKDEVEMEDE